MCGAWASPVGPGSTLSGHVELGPSLRQWKRARSGLTPLRPPKAELGGGSGMLRYIVRRLAAGLATLFVASVIVLAATVVLPGSPASAVLGKAATPAAVAPSTIGWVDWIGSQSVPQVVGRLHSRRLR